MLGTIVNTTAVIAGSAIGLLIRKNLSERMVDIVFQALGLVTIAIGVSMAVAMENILLAVVSLVLGAVAGQWIGIDKYLGRFSGWLQRKTRSKGEDRATGRFTEGFVTATMLFCIGSMSILGSIEDGMGQTPTLLYTKSIMDATSSVILASTLGIGVMFACVPMLAYQGGITILAAFVMNYMNDVMIADMTGVGGILIIGLGVNLLKIKNINVVNMLPALIFIVALSYFFG